MDRRNLLLGTLSAPLLAMAAAAAPRLAEDGLYHHDWFIESFLDLAEDVAQAGAAGRRLAILWGLKGCPACKIMHEQHLADEAIVAYIRARFDILHLNILGDRVVTDFDGNKLGEKALAQAYGIRTTPTIQFLPASVDGLASREPQKREVARMPGLLDKPLFLAMFRYVASEGYREKPFQDWLKNSAG